MCHSLAKQVLQWSVFWTWGLRRFTAHNNICLWDNTESKTNSFHFHFHWTFNLPDWLVANMAPTFRAYHRTLFQVWVAPWGDPATIGTWMGLLAHGAMLSSLRARFLHAASRDCSFDSIPSSRWLIDPVNDTNKFWKKFKSKIKLYQLHINVWPVNSIWFIKSCYLNKSDILIAIVILLAVA